MTGCVRLRVEGLMLEKLTARALNEGARFSRLTRVGRRVLLVETDAAGAAVLEALCQRFSISCRRLENRGLYALLLRLKRRRTLPAALIVCAACMALFFSRVWFVDVVCVSGATPDLAPIRQRLSELGVRPGMARSDLDAEALQGELAAADSDCSFVGARLQGVRLHIELAAAVAEPELYELDGGRDLVAGCDGVVESVRVLSGAAAVAPGDVVRRGQTLIRGEERVTKEETRSIAALGDVTVRTWTQGEAAAPIRRTVWRDTGRKSVSAELRLWDFSRPLTGREEYARFRAKTETLPVGGMFLPLEIVRTTRWETEPRPETSDPNALERNLTLLARAQALSMRPETPCEIAREWTEKQTDADGNLRVRAVVEWKTSVAVTRGALYRQGG